MKKSVSPDLQLELEGYRLITAEIVYYLPDHPDLLQVFIWQTLDRPPHFPRLRAFLNFWQHNIEGKLFSVKIGYVEDVGASKARFAKYQFNIS